MTVGAKLGAQAPVVKAPSVTMSKLAVRSQGTAAVNEDAAYGVAAGGILISFGEGLSYSVWY